MVSEEQSRDLADPLAPRFGLGISNCRPYSNVLEAVSLAESWGAEIAFVAEDINCRDTFQLLARAAEKTSSIRLATGVVNPYTRNPTSIAMSVATLDEMSGGRATLGLGTSTPSLIEGKMGIPTGRSLARMSEATEIIRSLLDGETVVYAGTHFQYRDATLEVRPVQVHVPIFFAAMGPRMLRLAGALADGVLLNVGASVQYVRWAVAQVAAGAEEAGRRMEDVTIAAWMSVYLIEDGEGIPPRARNWLAKALAVPRQGELLLAQENVDGSILSEIRSTRLENPGRAGDIIPAEIVRRLALIGTREQVASRLAEYRMAGVQIPVISQKALEGLRRLI